MREGRAASKLPARYHEAYQKRLQGMSVDDVAVHFGKSKSTIHRWMQAVIAEFKQHLEDTPQLNIIAEQYAKLVAIQEQALENAERTKSDRAKASFLAEARRAIVAQSKLLMQTGIIEKAPDRLFKAVAVLKPDDVKEGKREVILSRPDAIRELVDKMQRARQL